ncbi:MAG TPA: MASE1 domain-containing protein [Pinirhizobacter sp.]|uniref:MASE1 domain-containing protein n=1 Tax=Pinirhizobacter sp. TaxID=2950432 RepID=UPI002B5755F9|nr:MASE1 domain-containing protein [Pinirhizobacter sp.]HMH68966.1 MASE1 domain-containing protein [Pinirhizobacter sp.]
MKGSTEGEIVRAAPWVWGQHIAIAAAYGVIYQVALYVSFPQFLLTTGLRLACLLLLPVRYWPAIAIGEGLPLVENAVLCAGRFGIPWAILASFPTVALWMPLLKPIRERWPLYDPDGRLRMPMILLATLGAAVITAAITTATLIAALLHSPGKWPEISPVDFFFAYVLGAYLGALTLTPMILALHERVRALHDKTLSISVIWHSPLFRDVFWWVFPALASIAWLAATTHDDTLRQVARLALLWPVLGLAWRHGWHGTAVGGMGASLALAVTAKGLLDPATIQVQVFLAFALSGTLLMGTRKQTLRAEARPERS